jgi:hypothetical protein
MQRRGHGSSRPERRSFPVSSNSRHSLLPRWTGQLPRAGPLAICAHVVLQPGEQRQAIPVFGRIFPALNGVRAMQHYRSATPRARDLRQKQEKRLRMLRLQTIAIPGCQRHALRLFRADIAHIQQLLMYGLPLWRSFSKGKC